MDTKGHAACLLSSCKRREWPNVARLSSLNTRASIYQTAMIWQVSVDNLRALAESRIQRDPPIFAPGKWQSYGPYE